MHMCACLCVNICICGGQRSTSSVIPQELSVWFYETGSSTWTWPGWPVSLKGSSLSTSAVMELQTYFTLPSFACGCWLYLRASCLHSKLSLAAWFTQPVGGAFLVHLCLLSAGTKSVCHHGLFYKRKRTIMVSTCDPTLGQSETFVCLFFVFRDRVSL